MGPYGPGGYELSLAFATPRFLYQVSFAPLSWALGWSAPDADTRMLQLACFKVIVRYSRWIGDAC